MSQTHWLYFILLAELALFLALALALIGVLALRRRNRQLQAAASVTTRVKQGEADREKLLRQELGERFGLEGPALDAKVGQLLAAERAFYSHLMDTFVKRDHEQARRLPERVDELVRPYREIVVDPTPASQAPSGEQTPAPTKPGAKPKADSEDDIPVSATPQVLLDRTRRLAHDVTVYRQALNQLFAEYTAMFGVQIDRSRELSAQEIMERLESGQLAGADDVAEDSQDGSQR